MPNDLAPITLCADDYGYRPGIDRAIRALAEAGRISATSALVTMPDWPAAARHVPELAERIDVGLHLNLVEGAPLGPMPRLAPNGRLPAIGALIGRALRGAVDASEIRDEVRRQIDAFAAAAGRLPDFVDGHQHAHALPGIRMAVLDALQVAGLAGVPVRDPGDRFARIVRRDVGVGKAVIIAALARGFAREAASRGFARNEGFSGVYDFAPMRDLDDAFARFLAARGARHLVMCHPGYSEEAPDDPIAPARAQEADYLMSEPFARRLEVSGTRLARFTDIAAKA